MILTRADGTFSAVGAMLIGGNKLVGFEGRLKKGDESSRRLVVENKMSDGKRLGFEKGKDFAKGRY